METTQTIELFRMHLKVNVQMIDIIIDDNALDSSYHLSLYQFMPAKSVILLPYSNYALHF